ncbi:hypothetical protein BKA93DRAFT_871257 [Sparassis latifolia]
MGTHPGDSQDTAAASILSAVQTFTAPDALPPQSLHPFSLTPPYGSVSSLREVIELTTQITNSLNTHLSLPLLNPKLLSLYRQLTAISHTAQSSDQHIRHAVSVLRKRVGITYGEDVPLDRATIVDWCMSRLEAWGTSAGMEAFREEERDGRMTVVLGGKVLVLDIDFLVDRTDPEKPSIRVATLKTSYAIPNGSAGSTTGYSLSLDGFLAGSLQAFLTEVQKESDVQDSIEAGRLGMLFSEHLSYLMKLDQLALSEGDGGLRWFKDIDNLVLAVEQFATSEANAVNASGQRGAPVPLDVFIMRSHALPLPYLTAPSISFLISISPLSYLSLLRAPASILAAPVSKLNLPNLDIPFGRLRSHLSSHPRPAGTTVATLVLSSAKMSLPNADQISMPNLGTRPTFALVPSGSDIEHTFPQVSAAGTDAPGWILDFTEGGKYPGVVMSQSRLREVEFVVNPLGGMNHVGGVPMMTFGSGSWLNLLLSPQATLPPEHYTALYTSPTSAHPPLQLRLAAPEEPGFFLEAVPVRTLKEVWGILEIIKEQCWLNEIVDGYPWVPEGLAAQDDTDMTDIEATENELDALLGGTLNPRKLPVNVYLPPSPADLFDPDDMDALSLPSNHRGARIVMTSPERPPMPGLVEISVTFEPRRPRGVSVEINGAMGADLQIDVLEEVCRRGGLLGLPGRVWVQAQGAV